MALVEAQSYINRIHGKIYNHVRGYNSVFMVISTVFMVIFVVFRVIFTVSGIIEGDFLS